MKAAIRRVEPRLPKEGGYAKGRVILATVRGDVHDIGKNLVDIILSNNGFEVRNLGIKQPIEAILQAHREWPADAIGLSGLLVKSTVVMKEDLAFMARQGCTVPVILGGAALTRDYVATECAGAYAPGPVAYAEDAFEGLRVLQGLVAGKGMVRSAPEPSTIRVLHRGNASVPLDFTGRSDWVKAREERPEPPFWGVRECPLDLPELFEYLDTFALIRTRWGFTQGTLSDEAFGALLAEKAEPLLERWKRRLLNAPILAPRALRGYFPVRSRGETLEVLDPRDSGRVLARWVFPRQASSRRLCIADFFASTGRPDVLPLQLVTLGTSAAEHSAALFQADNYSDYHTFHGLATELTEACAELVHARIRRELGIHGRDAADRRQLFSQGYQGSRYSFGYPACPDLGGNGPLLDLLGGEGLGVALSETFQMVPEFTTSALVAWHPQARYFAASVSS
jgi:5-methyltetrahydrofolate--homocysteine methyltransferase